MKGRLSLAAAVLCLGAAVLALAFAAAPAHAFFGWEHGTATDCVSCHTTVGQDPTSAVCQTCHTAQFKLTAGQTCWTCHAPGADTSALRTSAACASSCHLFSESAHDFVVPFTHGGSPHLGASGFGKTCVDCHAVSTSATDPGNSPHHSGVTTPTPACADCHNGTLASAKTSHDGVQCASCHDGMNRPATPSVCLRCHTTIGYSSSNPRTCTDSSCHGPQAVHTATPALTQTCVDCHTAEATGHFTGLGTCTTCHPDLNGYHHGIAKAVPLANCATCHNGTIASAHQNHSTVTPACTVCHGVSMSVPSVPGVCSTCHAPATFGTAVCTTCHSKTGVFKQEQIHNNTLSESALCGACHAGYKKHAGKLQCNACHTTVAAFHHGTGTTPGFKTCTQCHSKKHAGRALAKSTCVRCHTGTAPTGKPRAQHSSTIRRTQNCAICHRGLQVHAKSRRASMTCYSCHAGKFHGKQTIPTKKVCLKCHARAARHAVGFSCLLCHLRAVHNAKPPRLRPAL